MSGKDGLKADIAFDVLAIPEKAKPWLQFSDERLWAKFFRSWWYFGPLSVSGDEVRGLK